MNLISIRRLSCFHVLFFTLVSSFMFITAGWADIPTSEYPVEIQRTFYVSFNEVWDNTLEILETFDGTIIAKDKSSGLITYKISANSSGHKTFINIYIKRNQNITTTNVYVITYDCSRYTDTRFPGRRVQLLFFDIFIQKSYFMEISSLFFEKLEKKVGIK